MDIQNLASIKRFPLIGNFELTRKCPLNCLICYNERKTNMYEMKTSEIKKIADELASLGCLHINLTGGDPLIRSDFVEIYNHFLSLGIFPSVETGLTYLTEDIIEVLRNYHPERLFVSLYAMSEDVYKRATRSNVSVNNVLKNIETLLKLDIPLVLRTPVTVINLNEIGLISKFAKSHKIEYRATCKIFWKQNGERNEEYRCTSAMIKNLIDQDPIYESLYKEAVMLEETGPIKKSCKTGIYDFNINPYGEVNFCITFWKPEIDILNSSFSEVWNNFYPMFRRQEDDYCLAKELLTNGERCPWGDIYNNDKFDASKSLIQVAREHIEKSINDGLTEEELCIKLKLTKDAYEYIMLEGCKKHEQY